MKNLFTLTSIGKKYSLYAHRLVNNLLDKTAYDIRVATDCPVTFEEIKNTRIIIIDITEQLKLNKIFMNDVFNYNLKFYAFDDIPEKYESVFYLDCDQGIRVWDDARFVNFLTQSFNNGRDFIATRTNCILDWHLDNYRVKKNSDLFGHKFENYKLTVENIPANWLKARLPSEHFLVLKNDPKKLKIFYETWKMLNSRTEEIVGFADTRCDAFEIGISATEAEYVMEDANSDIQANVFGIVFNGNKDS